jgi:hypothetical protein
MAGAKRRMMEEAKRLGMSVAMLRSLPVSEIRKRIDARVKELDAKIREHSVPKGVARG